MAAEAPMRQKESITWPDLQAIKRMREEKGELERLKAEIRQLRNMMATIRKTEHAKKLNAMALNKKQWLKMVERINDPAYCEALIIQLETRKRHLEAGLSDHSPT